MYMQGKQAIHLNGRDDAGAARRPQDMATTRQPTAKLTPRTSRAGLGQGRERTPALLKCVLKAGRA